MVWVGATLRRVCPLHTVHTAQCARCAVCRVQWCGVLLGRAIRGWTGLASCSLTCSVPCPRLHIGTELAGPDLPLAASPDMIGWSRVLLSHTLDAARPY